MNCLKSEIIVLIDVSSFYTGSVKVSDLIDHVKEAVSFQISRGAITNRKLIKLGLEPYLARVRWTYKFFDSSNCDEKRKVSKVSKNYLQTLTYECWDSFEKDLNEAVKTHTATFKECKVATESERMRKIVEAMEELEISEWPCDEVSLPASSMIKHLDLAGSINTSHGTGRMSKGTPKFIYIFTHIPKIFSCLIHLAYGVTKCRYSLSSAVNCSLHEIQVCLVDLKFDSLSITLRDYNGLEALPCFWDEFYGNGNEPILKVLCLKKIMMIHKLMEMRYPWMYEYFLRQPFGFGLGMKRLRQWEWPKELPKVKREREPRCSPLRKCWSEEIYGIGMI